MKERILQILNDNSIPSLNGPIIEYPQFEQIADEIEEAYATMIVDSWIDDEVDELISKLNDE
jgi:hypothetical protein